jgi:hypothetical protein
MLKRSIETILVRFADSIRRNGLGVSAVELAELHTVDR